MKKSVFQLIIISILLAGMVGIIVAVKTSFATVSYNEYYPTEDSANQQNQGDEEVPQLTGYTEVKMTNQTFFSFTDLRSSKTYYDSELSFEEVFLDEITVGIGTRVNAGDVLGKLDNSDFESTVDGIVVDKTSEKITIKILSELYAQFDINIYKKSEYVVGDKFDVFKNGIKVTTAELVFIDYLEVVDDCVKATLKIQNDDLYFVSAGYIEFSPTGYATETSFAINPSVLYIETTSYQVLDKVYAFLCVKDSKVYELQIQFGICYYNYVQIKYVWCDYVNFNLSGVLLYVKSAY
ncbi:MAG: HlyD family secretion protein [Christensenellaceae bacterium]|nr:HlyD family secretion protein [Christensenellaceae bacterium]